MRLIALLHGILTPVFPDLIGKLYLVITYTKRVIIDAAIYDNPFLL